ncbi:hypothetical protein Rhe02_98000 [Rhizocola hellebori]|uniref:Uncharacterized protein n=1 Tax=Rhizocola hellebori TaxID=1392758 RepID=A0A8J3QIW7_9ACTN|nr:hypothetical protein Rhe02_98000 [Rhizocola hellebori]
MNLSNVLIKPKTNLVEQLRHRLPMDIPWLAVSNGTNQRILERVDAIHHFLIPIRGYKVDELGMILPSVGQQLRSKCGN